MSVCGTFTVGKSESVSSRASAESLGESKDAIDASEGWLKNPLPMLTSQCHHFKQVNYPCGFGI